MADEFQIIISSSGKYVHRFTLGHERLSIFDIQTFSNFQFQMLKLNNQSFSYCTLSV